MEDEIDGSVEVVADDQMGENGWRILQDHSLGQNSNSTLERSVRDTLYCNNYKENKIIKREGQNKAFLETHQPDVSTRQENLDHGNESSEEEEESFISSEAEISKAKCNLIVIALVWLFLFTTVVASVAGSLFVYIYLKLLNWEAAQELIDQKVNKSIKEAESNYNLLSKNLDTLGISIAQLHDKVNKSLKKANSLQQYITGLKTKEISFSHLTFFSPGYPELSSSCYDIKSDEPEITSGYHFIKSHDEQLQHVYCNMESCGNNAQGWMRVAKLDVNRCPFKFKQVKYEGFVVCATLKEGCTSIYYSVFNVKYSKICGQVRGVMSGTPDGFLGRGRSVNSKITDVYVDGISIISSSLKHIWTFTTGNCDCAARKPNFIENDWVCDARERCQGWCKPPLWNSQKCNSEDSWFSKSMLDSADDIIVRVCHDQRYDDEDILLQKLELYVQ